MASANRPTRFCFLVGAGGTGKSTLVDMFVSNATADVGKISEVARNIMEEHGIKQADLAEDNIFWDLQLAIARRQLDEERKYEASRYELVISDRSVMDAVVYTLMRFPFKVSSNPTYEKDSMFSLLCKLVGSVRDANELLFRYRSSLVVIVYPFDDNDSIDDNVRMLMKSTELVKFTATCREVMKLLDVPFLDLKECSKQGRLNLLQEAVQKGNVVT